MKLLKYALFISFALLFTACSVKQEQMIAAQKIDNFDIEKNIKKSKIVKIDNFTENMTRYTLDVNISKEYNLGGRSLYFGDTVTTYTTVEKINDNLYQVQLGLRHMINKDWFGIESIAPTMLMLMKHLDGIDIRYFQIIEPALVSNTRGFPINNIADLTAFLSPNIGNPSDDTDLTNDVLLVRSKYNGDHIDGEFQKFTIFIKTIDNPTPEQIVWNVKRNLQ